MTLYDKTTDAESKVSTYRTADIGEWVDAIDPVLEAIGECTIGFDKVEDIIISEDIVTIHTSYSVRGCNQTNDISVPISILKSTNPIKEATLYRLVNKLSESKSRLASAQRSLIEYTEKVYSLEVVISHLNSTN